MPTKTSSAARPLSRTTARNCALVNQLATPGLGSLMAGHRPAGIGQLLIAVTGFTLVLTWFVLNTAGVYNQFINDAEPKPVGWLGELGALTFVVAWVWSLSTSFQIIRSSKDTHPERVPPHLSQGPARGPGDPKA